MKFLVTGSEGNIGSVLVPYLQSKGHSVLRLGRRPIFADDYILCDINNLNDLYWAFNDFKPDIVIHLAAMVSRITCEKSPSTTVHTNLGGTYNLMQLCENYNSRFVFFSTSEVYGNIGGALHEERRPLPNNLYGLTKLMGEELVNYERGNGLDAVIIRPFMMYDERESFGVNRSAMIRFAESLVLKKKITIHKESIRSWLHTDDAVKIILLASLQNNITLLNIGHPEAIYTQDLACKMCHYLGLYYKDYVEEEILPAKMTLTKHPVLNRQMSLGFVPAISIADGIKRVIDKTKERLHYEN